MGGQVISIRIVLGKVPPPYYTHILAKRAYTDRKTRQEDLEVTMTERNGQRSGPTGVRGGVEQPSSATALPLEANLDVL